MQETVASYGTGLQQVHETTARHGAEVAAAGDEHEIADAERRYAGQMGRSLDDLGQLVEAMGSCGHHPEHARHVAALREDLGAMRDMYEGHRATMEALSDESAPDRERPYQMEVQTAFESWATHQRAMAVHAADCPCGGTSGGMMGH